MSARPDKDHDAAGPLVVVWLTPAPAALVADLWGSSLQLRPLVTALAVLSTSSTPPRARAETARSLTTRPRARQITDTELEIGCQGVESGADAPGVERYGQTTTRWIDLVERSDQVRQHAGGVCAQVDRAESADGRQWDGGFGPPKIEPPTGAGGAGELRADAY